MSIANLISLLSGIALFLFGMALMGDGLKKVAANKLEVILFQLTGSLTAVPETGYGTPSETQIFHRAVPGAAVSKVGLGNKYHSPQCVDAAVAAQRPLGGKSAVKIVKWGRKAPPK